MKRRERKEGFWYSDREQHLPRPEAHKGEITNKDKILSRLSIVEAKSQEIEYRGSSTCRICGCQNGSVSFKLEGWEWPEGYRHYIDVHNVWPSRDFKDFLREEADE